MTDEELKDEELTDEELKKEWMRQNKKSTWNDLYTASFNNWKASRGTELNGMASNPVSEETLNKGAEKATNIEHKANSATTSEERDAVAEEARKTMNNAAAAQNSVHKETFNPNNAEAEEPSLQLPEESPKTTEIKSTLTDTEEETEPDIDTIMNKPDIKETTAELGIDPDREVPPTPEELEAATEEAAVKAEAIGASPETVDAITRASRGDAKDIESAGKSEYEKAKAATDSDSAMSKWDRLSKILTVVSAFVHVISEGTIPPIDFTEFSQYEQKKKERDDAKRARFEKDLGTEGEITDMLGEIQKGRAWDEEKTKEVQNIIMQEGLQEKIKETHPDWTKEQIMKEAVKQAEDTFQRRNAAANVEGTSAGNADLGAKLRDKKFAEDCSPKEAQETIQQVDEQIRQIDEAIISLKDKQFDKGITIYNNMVTLFAGLSSTVSTKSESTSKNKSKTEGSNDGLNAGLGFGPVNVGGQYGSQAGTSEGSSNAKANTVGTTEASREGIDISAKLSDDYKKNTDKDYAKAIANLEAMKKNLVERRKQFEAKASQYGKDNNVTNINNSDVRKKHVYIPKEKRLKR